MKLYATVTSERASKGQGGNEYIEIDLLGEDKIILAKLILKKHTHDEGRYLITEDIFFRSHRLEVAVYKNIDEIPLKEKGEKQKGEHELKIHSLHDAQASCKCGWYYAFTGEMSRELVEEEYRKHIQ